MKCTVHDASAFSSWSSLKCDCAKNCPQSTGEHVYLHNSGARRGLLQLPGVEEDVGMVGIHWRSQFIEMVPWNGDVQVGTLLSGFHAPPSLLRPEATHVSMLAH